MSVNLKRAEFENETMFLAWLQELIDHDLRFLKQYQSCMDPIWHYHVANTCQYSPAALLLVPISPPGPSARIRSVFIYL